MPFLSKGFRFAPRLDWPDINRQVCRSQYLSQSVFCDVYAAAKTDWIFFAAPEPRILRLLDEYKMRGHPTDALSFYIHAAIGKISFKTPKITAEIAAASRKPWQMRRLFAANLASSCSF